MPKIILEKSNEPAVAVRKLLQQIKKTGTAKGEKCFLRIESLIEVELLTKNGYKLFTDLHTVLAKFIYKNAAKTEQLYWLSH